MKTLNLVLFGVGNVGSTLINKILGLKKQLGGNGEFEMNLLAAFNLPMLRLQFIPNLMGASYCVSGSWRRGSS